MARTKDSSHRSNTAAARRALSDLKKVQSRVMKALTKLKAKKGKTSDDKVVISDTKDTLTTYAMLMVALENNLNRLGLLQGSPKEPLTPAEEQEIISLRTTGLHGRPMYTKKELAYQYGVSLDTINELEHNVPL